MGGEGGLFDLLRKKENVKFETAKQEVMDAIKKNCAPVSIGQGKKQRLTHGSAP